MKLRRKLKSDKLGFFVLIPYQLVTPTDLERKEFIQLFGLGAISVLSGSCLSSCGSQKEDDPKPPEQPANVDFTLDLSAPANAPLNDPQIGYVYALNNLIIVAKTTAGSYLALAAPCTHQGTLVTYQTNQNNFYCPSHASLFSPEGKVLGGPAPAALKRYTTTLTGTMLRVKD